MDQLRAIRYFSKVVETGSFTKAAKAFDVPPSSLSRRVSDLEKSLGATLLKRSTRLVKLTEVGQVYYDDVQHILNQLEQSKETIRSYQTTPMGSNIVGVRKWSVDGERCFNYWAKVNTDCSVCIRVCPYNRDYSDPANREWLEFAGADPQAALEASDRSAHGERLLPRDWWPGEG